MIPRNFPEPWSAEDGTQSSTENNCCVCGYVRQAQIILTSGPTNKLICRTCASHVKAQVEYIRSCEETQVTANEVSLRRRLQSKVQNSFSAGRRKVSLS
jgi:hypothetical protein